MVPPCATFADPSDRLESLRISHENVPAGKRCLPVLSARGEKHGSKVTAFWDVFDRIIGNAFCETSNPHGIVNMAISNNYLLEPELLAYFSANLQMQPTDLTYGTSLFGSHRLFATLCKHFNSSTFHPHLRVEPGHLISGPGCGALLDQLAEHLAEPGDGVLIAAPYYNGYDADMACRGEVQCVPVFSAEDDGTGARNFEGPSALRGFADAKLAWEQSHTSNKVRAVIVCNPHNPVGRCYDREALLAYGRFAEEHDVHLVFDEIFALSTYTPPSDPSSKTPEPFHSALSIDWSAEAGCHPGRIHVIWSASKDFGVNGLRVGTLISQYNPSLLRAMKATAKLYMVSSPADALFCSLIDNEDVYRDFVETNQVRTAQAYDIFTRWAKHHSIDFTPCSAGHFILVDLTRFLPVEVEGRPLVDGAAREGALWTKLLENAVCMTPGSNYHHPQLGIFRLTFTLRRPALVEGLRRIEKALGLAAWPEFAQEALAEPERPMQTIDVKAIRRSSAASASTALQMRGRGVQAGQDGHCRTESASSSLSPVEAEAERQEYVNAVRQVLKEGGGSEALLSCGMGMSCSACS